MPRLTKRLIDAAERREEPYFIWCSELPGFGVRVFPSGKRTYYADYRTRDGLRRRMSIGPHGKLTTEEARDLALVALADAVKGNDPAGDRASRRKSMTVAELCEAYMVAAHKGLIQGKRGRAKKASTLEIDRGRIDRHIKPVLGSKLVVDLTLADVQRFVRDVSLGKTASKERVRGRLIVTGGAGTAARTVGFLGGILAYAVSEGVRPDNPARGVKVAAWTPRTRRLTAAEYRAFGEAIAAAENEGELPQSIAGTRLLALTGCRLGEIEMLRPEEIDEAGCCFRLTDTKEGASVRPIGRPAFEVLRTVKRLPGKPFVFMGARRDNYSRSLPAAFDRIVTRSKLERFTPHILRHSYASVAGDLGYSESTIAALLGHAAGTVTSRYVHHLDSVLVAAADRVARTIHGYMTGEASNVVHLPVARSA